jgi:hypothetical protein
MPAKKKGIRVTVHDLDTGEQVSTHEIVGGLANLCTCCTTTTIVDPRGPVEE